MTVRGVTSCPLPHRVSATMKSGDPCLAPQDSWRNGGAGDFGRTSCLDLLDASYLFAARCSAAYLLHPSFFETPSGAYLSGKTKLEVPPKMTQHLSKTATRSLGDLKVCRGTRGLMARFLHRSKRNLVWSSAETAGRGTQGCKQVGGRMEIRVLDGEKILVL